MEQQNGSLVRRFAGYHRLASPELVAWLGDLYLDLCPCATSTAISPLSLSY